MTDNTVAERLNALATQEPPAVPLSDVRRVLAAGALSAQAISIIELCLLCAPNFRYGRDVFAVVELSQLVRTALIGYTAKSSATVQKELQDFSMYLAQQGKPIWVRLRG